MTTRIREFIKQIRDCKTASEERAVIAKESAALRTLFKRNDNTNKAASIAKLVYLHMLGYPTHFGQMECLKLIARPSFAEKRIGYLGLMALLDEKQEILMLVTNSIQQDLKVKNQYTMGLALCALGNICSAEMARDLATDVKRLMRSQVSAVVSPPQKTLSPPFSPLAPFFRERSHLTRKRARKALK